MISSREKAALGYTSMSPVFLSLRLLQTLEKVMASETVEKTHSYLDLVKTPQLRKITLVSGLFWYRIFL